MQIDRREFLRWLTAVSGACSAGRAFGMSGPEGRERDESSGVPKGVRRRPNVVMILADDLGWKDTGCYGSSYFETPHIDSLAGGGIRFTDAYAANPLCSPTRASILTGKNPDRTGITSPWCHKQKQDGYLPWKAEPFEKMVLPQPRTYLPFGKYTLAEALRDSGYSTVFVGKWHLGLEPHGPENNGFQTNIGGMSVGGPKSYFSPYENPYLEDGPAGEYLTDRLADEAAGWIDEHREEAFFICYWPYAVHGPYQAKEEYIRYFERKKASGIQRCPRMAAMVRSLDEGVGTVLGALERNDLVEDTIVIFMGDNGPSKGEVNGVPVSTARPLRNKKGSLYEGGVRVPLVVRWPGEVEAGSISEEVVVSTDIYPTILEMCNLELPGEQHKDGLSLVPVLKGTGKPDREAIFCHYASWGHAYEGPERPGPAHHIAGTFVRKGDWKLIRRYETNHAYFPDKYELFNLADDISETRNLAGRFPGKVRELDAMMDAYLEDTGALVPKANPAYDRRYEYLYPARYSLD